MWISYSLNSLQLFYCQFCPFSSHNTPLSLHSTSVKKTKKTTKKNPVLKTSLPGIVTHKWWHLLRTISTSKPQKSQTPSKLTTKFWRSHIVVILNKQQPQSHCLLVSTTPKSPQPSLVHSSHGSLGLPPDQPLSHTVPTATSLPHLGLQCPANQPGPEPENHSSAHTNLSDLLIPWPL